MACNTKWCVLVDTWVTKYVSLPDDKFRFVLWDEFEKNPDQYRLQIDAVCGVYGAQVLMKHGKDESFFKRMPNVKVVFSCGIGTDHLDLPMLWNNGIRVANTGHFNACCTAEFGFTLVMASAKNLKPAMTAYQGNMSLDLARNTYRGSRLMGSTLGIVGMGTIGYMVAERAAAFKMKILYHNRNRRSEKDETQVQAKYCNSLDTLLVQCDFVMLCLPLNNDTRGFFGAKEFKLMKPTSVFINIARGAIVDQDALTKALQDKVIGGAALDVTTPEPLPPDHPLLQMPNVIVTPHYAGLTTESAKEMPLVVLSNLTAGLEGKPMLQEIKPKE